MSNSTRCAACKYLRKKCPKDCLLAPYFPSSNPQRFSTVHKIFGASNITKMLQQLPVHLRAEAADCLCFEASSRVQDPVYGCVAIISQLQHQIFQAQSEIAKTRSEIAFYHAKPLQQQQQQQVVHNVNQQVEASWLSSGQQDPLYLDQQLSPNFYQQSHY